MTSQIRRLENRRSATKYKPYTVAHNDDDEEFLPGSQKKTSRPAVSRTTSTASSDRKKPKTTSEPLPPPTTNLGLPTLEQYRAIEEEYIHSLHPRKREKALLSQAMFDMIWDVLHDPLRSRVGSPQFRWWVRKMFVLSHEGAEGQPDTEETMAVVLHENRPVALKEQIYDVLCYCHERSNHGGRDKTTMVIREHYSWIPKELVAQFVKVCPTCVYKKTGNRDLAHALADVANSPLLKMERDEDKYGDENAVGAQAPGVVYPRIPMMPEPSAFPGLVKTEGTPSPDWSTASLPPVHPPSTILASPNIDWSTGIAPGHLLAEPGYFGQPQGLPPVRRLHSAEDAFAFNDQSRITLPPLQQVLSDSGLRLGHPWPSGPAMPPHVWESSAAAWTASALQDCQSPIDLAAQTSLAFVSDSPLPSPMRKLYQSGNIEESIEEQRALHIDPALLGPADDYLTAGDTDDAPETPRRMRRMLSVQSLVVGSTSMTSLTLRAEVEDAGQEAGTPVRRAVAGVLESGRSPGGSVYLHPSRFMLSG